MRSASDRPARTAQALRGIVAAVASTSIALLAHVLAGGTLPATTGVVATSALALVACLALAPLRHSRARLSLSVVASQLLFHALFTLGAPGPPAPVEQHHAASHAHHAAHGSAAPGPDAITAAADAVAHASHGALTMALAHVLAGAVTYVALRRGEAALDRLSSVAVALAARLLPPAASAQLPPVRPHRALASDAGAWVPPFQAHVATSVVRRGPPAHALA